MFHGLSKRFFDPASVLNFIEYEVDDDSFERVNQWLYEVIDAEAA